MDAFTLQQHSSCDSPLCGLQRYMALCSAVHRAEPLESGPLAHMPSLQHGDPAEAVCVTRCVDGGREASPFSATPANLPFYY